MPRGRRSKKKNRSILDIQVVESLPTENINPNTIYLVPKVDPNEETNYYEEYLYNNDKFEKIGDTKIDLSGYATKTEVQEAVAGLEEAITTLRNDFGTIIGDLNNLTTVDKTNIVAAINEAKQHPIKSMSGYVHLDTLAEGVYICTNLTGMGWTGWFGSSFGQVPTYEGTLIIKAGSLAFIVWNEKDVYGNNGI